MNAVVDFYKSYRVGLSVGKTLLWLWVKKDLPELVGDIGVDLAGGAMLNKRFFSTKKYICVDKDENKLKRGKAKNPDAYDLNITIQDFLQDSEKEVPDVLVCLQTMGINELFEHNETVEVVHAMCGAVRTGGSIIFNIGNFSLNINEIEPKVLEILNGKFEEIKVKPYGAMHITGKRPLPGPVNLMLAYLMDIFPPLRTFFGLKRTTIYYCCKNKLHADLPN